MESENPIFLMIDRKRTFPTLHYDTSPPPYNDHPPLATRLPEQTCQRYRLGQIPSGNFYAISGSYAVRS